MFFVKDKKLTDYALDASIIQALNAMNIIHPSRTQAEVLPLALAGQDVLVRAKTGSGKTFAFCLPLIQKVLRNHEISGPLGVILVPTRELCSQIEQVLKACLDYCEENISVFTVTGARNKNVETPRLKENPHIIIGTPSRIAQHIKAGNLNLLNLKMLCIDEADLIFSFGYEDDMKLITQNLPQRSYQCILTSATLTDNVLTLKQLVMHNAKTVEIVECEEDVNRLAEFYSISDEEEKFLLLFGFVKLQLVKGKILIFVNSLSRCYKVKLFLEKFSVAVGVLNDELPYNTRMNIINQFNSGILDYLIATDSSVEIEESVEDFLESSSDESEEEEEEEKNDEEKDDEEKDGEEKVGKKRKRNISKIEARKKRRTNKGFGVHRGVDFREVSAVVNFDFPPTEKNYTHRVGRTARGGNFGLAISFVNDDENEIFEEIQQKKRENGQGSESEIQTLNLTADLLKPFKYRIQTVLGQCNRKNAKEIRIRELEMEMLNSKKIKERLSGTRELEMLRHDKLLRAHEIDKSLSTIPKYLRDQLPFQIDNEQMNYQTLTGLEFDPARRMKKQPKRKKRGNNRKKHKRKGKDPLKNFGRR